MRIRNKKYYIIWLCILTLLIVSLAILFKPSAFLNKDRDRTEIISVYHYNRDITSDIIDEDLIEALKDMRVARTLEVYAPYAQADVVWEINLQLNGERWCVILGGENLNFAKGNGLYRKILNWYEINDFLKNSIISTA